MAPALAAAAVTDVLVATVANVWCIQLPALDRLGRLQEASEAAAAIWPISLFQATNTACTAEATIITTTCTVGKVFMLGTTCPGTLLGTTIFLTFFSTAHIVLP